MTPKQHKILAIIDRCIAANGYAPSLDEIATANGGGSRPNMHAMVAKLIARGYLIREDNGIPGRVRDLRLTEQGKAALAPQGGDALGAIPTHVLQAELSRRMREASI